jgi:hypothetical protein
MQEKLGELLGRRIGDSLTISIFMNMENGILSTEDETLLRETGHSGWKPAFGRFMGMIQGLTYHQIDRDNGIIRKYSTIEKPAQAN